MNKKNVSISIFSFLSIISLLKYKVAEAVCPLCTVAVASGVGFSRWLGIDDTISGLWIGALTLSMAFWNINWFIKKKIKFRLMKPITVIAYYAIVVLPLWSMGIIGNKLGELKPFGMNNGISMDKLTLGVLVGTFTFWTSVEWYEHIKAKNNGHAHFPFEKVAIPIGSLFLFSLIFFFLTK